MTEDPQRRDDTGEADDGYRPVNDVPSDIAAEGAPVPVDVPVRVEESGPRRRGRCRGNFRSALAMTLGVQGSPSLDRLSVAETKTLSSSIVGIEAALDAVLVLVRWCASRPR